MEIKGFTFGFDGRRGDYQKPAAFDSLQKLHATGSQWVCLAFIVHQKKYSDTEILFDYRNGITDKDLTVAINYIHKLGMKVCLKPVINCYDRMWRAMINFPDMDMMGKDVYWDEWFNSYNAFLCHYAEIAQDTGCEMYCVGCEMQGTERKENHWRRTIESVRGVYSGPLTYNTNHGDEENVKWFDAVDYPGVSAYYPVAEGPGATEEEMYQHWLKRRDKLKSLSERLKKPILFAEVGCRSAAGCAAMPWDFMHKEFPYSEDEQANFYSSCLRAFFHEPWFAGFFWWEWSKDISDSNQWLKMSFNIHGKKAEQVLKDWYAK